MHEQSQAAGHRLSAYLLSATCSGLTGVRFRSKPVAWRMAATTAAVEDTVGGSPTPLAPKGPNELGSSMTSILMGGASRKVGSR